MKSKLELLEELEEIMNEFDLLLKADEHSGIYLHQALANHLHEESLRKVVDDMRLMLDKKQKDG